MKSPITSIRALSILFASLALGSAACSAAPDGEPSHDPASTTAVGDHASNAEGDAGSSASTSPAPSASGASLVTPGGAASGGGGGVPHGPPGHASVRKRAGAEFGGGGEGHTPHGQSRQ